MLSQSDKINLLL